MEKKKKKTSLPRLTIGGALTNKFYVRVESQPHVVASFRLRAICRLHRIQGHMVSEQLLWGLRGVFSKHTQQVVLGLRHRMLSGYERRAMNSGAQNVTKRKKARSVSAVQLPNGWFELNTTLYTWFHN